VNVITTLIANGEPPIVVKPGEGTFSHPPVAAQPLATLYPLTSYAALDAPLAKRLAAPRYVIRLVSVPLVRALARASPLASWTLDRLNVVHHLFKHRRVVSIGTRELYHKRNTPSLDHKMALRARFCLICGVRPNSLGLRVPFFTPLARTVSESKLALDQSILSASPRRLSSALWSLRHTPAFCQSRSLRQQVTPLPQPISWGSISQGRPLLSTKMMPERAARSGMRGRPPFGLGGAGGRSGSITSHSSSGTKGLLMPTATASLRPGFERRSYW
jgi:hypothetical protein